VLHLFDAVWFQRAARFGAMGTDGFLHPERQPALGAGDQGAQAWLKLEWCFTVAFAFLLTGLSVAFAFLLTGLSVAFAFLLTGLSDDSERTVV